MGNIVKNTFKEKHHNDTVYKTGDEYPKTGFKADPKRIEFLQKTHPEYGVQFLEGQVVEKKKADPVSKRPTNKPKDVAKSGDDE